MSTFRARGRGPLGALLALAIWPAGLQAQQTRIETLILSPEPGERIFPDAVLVAASFIDRDSQLDPATIVLSLDGRDVTAEAQVSAEVVTWIPRLPTTPGPHRVSLTARTRNGLPVAPASWAFTVAPGTEGALAAAQLQPGSGTARTRMQGSVTFEGTASSVSGEGADLRRDEGAVPRVWVKVGGLLGSSWRYSANVHLSGYESSTLQPVDRFRLDIRSNHINAAIGDVNPVLHDLILSGTRVRGVQGDVRGGGFRLTVVKGASRRAIPGLRDPTNTQVLHAGTYGRSLFAARPAIGGRNFQVGATVLRVRDDVASIPDLRIAESTTNQSVNSTPKDNVVLGTDVTLRLLGNRVLLRHDLAFSLFANDITGGALTEPQLDSILEAAGNRPLGIDPSAFEDYFIINASLIPLDPRGLTSLAQQASASVRAGTNILSAEWRSIGGSYYSLGYPALVRDRTGIRIRDSFTVLDNALSLSAGLERDKDNLADVKLNTTTSAGVFANASWQASPQSPTVVVSVRRQTRENGLAAGQSGALDEQSTTFSLGLGLPIGVFQGFRTRLNLNLATISRNDPANPTVESSDRYYLGGFQGSSVDRTSDFTLMYGLNTTELLAFTDAKTNFHRVVGNFRYLVRPQWTAMFDGTYTGARSPQTAAIDGLQYNRAEFLIGGQFEWTAASLVTLTAGLVSYADERFPTSNTREVVTRLRVHRAF